MSAVTAPADETKSTTNEGLQIQCGKLQVVPMCPPTTTPFTFDFPVGAANYGEVARWDYQAITDVDAAVTVNCTLEAITFDQVSLSGVQTIDKGISLGCQVTITNPALPASVTLQIEHVDIADSYTVPEYTYLRWVLASEVTENDQFLEATKHSLLTDMTGIVGYTRLARSTNQVQGIFTLEIDSMQLGVFWGLSTALAPDTNGDYMWNLAALQDHLIFEGGIPWSGITTNDNAANVALQIRDTGAAIQYWYKVPSGSWTMAFESMSPYTPNAPYWVDVCAEYDGQPIAPIKLYQY